MRVQSLHLLHGFYHLPATQELCSFNRPLFLCQSLPSHQCMCSQSPILSYFENKKVSKQKLRVDWHLVASHSQLKLLEVVCVCLPFPLQLSVVGSEPVTSLKVLLTKILTTSSVLNLLKFLVFIFFKIWTSL